MSKKKIFHLSKKYFNYFQNKNIKSLKGIFASNISLKDWDNKKKGRKEVLKFNSEIFRKFRKIKVNVKEKFYLKNFKIICFIEIRLNSKKLDVIDILEFNKKFEIKSIRAYLG